MTCCCATWRPDGSPSPEDLAAAVAAADAVFIGVGTPSRRGDGHADLSFVFAAAEEIGRALKGYTVVVTKSTVPVGTNRKVAERIRAVNPEAEFDVVSNPEFLREGAAIDDFMRPDRVVIGLESERARHVMGDIYRPLFLRDFPIVYTGLETAELIKYAANAFLATKITFINEIAALCERVGADVKAVSKGMGLDGRIGQKFLHAGPGYGGSCFPKDTLALARTGQEFGVPQHVTEAAIRVNDATRRRMIDKIVDLCGGSVNGKTIAVLGVTFKPNTDDMRDAPSLTIVPALVGQGAKVNVVDPQGKHEGQALLPAVTWMDDPYEAATGGRLRGDPHRVERVPRHGSGAPGVRPWRSPAWRISAMSMIGRMSWRPASRPMTPWVAEHGRMLVTGHSGLHRLSSGAAPSGRGLPGPRLRRHDRLL